MGRSALAKRFVQIGFVILVQGAILFGASGRLDWGLAWAYLAVYVGAVAINAAVLLRLNPDLIGERARGTEGAKAWDKLLAPVVAFFGPVATLVVTGLDERLNWSPEIASGVPPVALAAVAAGYLGFGWAMASNQFLAGGVRIQTERGHTVASAGPYRLVRHPSYVAITLYTLAMPLALGSAWGLAPAALTVAALVLRTALEDRALQAELPGYREYAGRVRYRLLPGVW